VTVSLACPVSLGELGAAHGGEIDEGAAARVISRVVEAWGDRDAGCLIPVLRVDAIDAALAGDATLLVDASLAARVPAGRRWVHANAAWALAGVLSPLAPRPRDERDRALIEPGAVIATSASIGAFAIVRAGAVVGEGSVIEPHATVFPGVTIGARVIVGAGAVIGRPGFGWAVGPGNDVRAMPQLGGVVIEDDVAIGANATIDAGTLGPTRIGRGAKLDAHVHVGHNARIGAGTMIAAQSGFAGSTRVGAGVLVGGQVGVADHVVVGDGARLAAKAGVISDVPPGATFAGYPAVDRLRWLRGMARLFPRRGS
jgi:UDP-3-O-[3-hydroxymyristoyl] glucosamine N-acyltransferase